MCDKVVEVEHALEDVRDMLRTSHTNNERAWKTEFCAVVQELVQQDAGWKYVLHDRSSSVTRTDSGSSWLTFWRMVAHALESAACQDGALPESGVRSCCCAFTFSINYSAGAQYRVEPAFSATLPLRACSSEASTRVHSGTGTTML